MISVSKEIPIKFKQLGLGDRYRKFSYYKSDGKFYMKIDDGFFNIAILPIREKTYNCFISYHKNQTV